MSKTHCDVILHWPDGDKQSIGRMDFEFKRDGMEGKPIRHMARWFGWAMVKHGVRMMLKGAKDDDEVH